MSFKRELETLNHQLNADRMKGKIDFTDITVEEENGKTYLIVSCTREKAVNDITKLYDESYIPDMFELDKTEDLNIYFVSHTTAEETPS